MAELGRVAIRAVRGVAVGLRKNVATLEATELANLRTAFTAAYGLGDDRGYAFYAGLHGLPLPIYCQHGTPLFLPWHRAYLYFFERALTDALGGDPSLVVSLPWWDWTSAASHANGLPDAYRPAQNGADNPLAAGPVTLSAADLGMVRSNLPGAISDGPNPVTVRDPELPDELPRSSTVARAMRANTFADFTTLLEGIHNGVHVWVGGAMSAVPIAAYDPVFWAHHSMVDRLWYLWQISPRGTDPPAALLDRALAPWPMTVRETLDISRLGYEYAAQVVG
ncbi:MAG: tyrosinase family protein [Pseudonocardiaceae bacterium]